MNKKWFAQLIAFGMLAAPAAYASDKQDFEGCDGRIHPGKQDDGLRGEAARNSYSFLEVFVASTSRHVRALLLAPAYCRLKDFAKLICCVHELLDICNRLKSTMPLLIWIWPTKKHWISRMTDFSNAVWGFHYPYCGHWR